MAFAPRTEPRGASVTPLNGVAYALCAGAAVFASAYVAGAALPGGSAKAVQTACAAGAVLAGYVLWPPRSRASGTGYASQAAWLICVPVAGGFAIIIATPASAFTPAAPGLVVAVGVMLFFMEGLTALLTGLLRDRSSAVLAVLTLICFAAAAPLWIGPWVEYFAGTDWFADLVVAISPLTYLAVMAEYDYLRDHWFYARAPYGAYRFGYPGQLVSSAAYIAFGIAFRIAAVFTWRGNSAAAPLSPTGGEDCS